MKVFMDAANTAEECAEVFVICKSTEPDKRDADYFIFTRKFRKFKYGWTNANEYDEHKAKKVKRFE